VPCRRRVEYDHAIFHRFDVSGGYPKKQVVISVSSSGVRAT
jgi:hypothetical protein